MPAIHQFSLSLAPHDAVSNHVFALRALFRSWGYRSDAYAVEVKPGAEEILPYRRLFRAVQGEDLLLLHFATGNELFGQLVRIPSRRVLVYHNITPPEYFDGVNPHYALYARLGHRQLPLLAPHVELAIGVSEFNRRELEAAGFPRTATVPVLVNWSAYDVAADERVVAKWSGVSTKLLFVGRIAPNKRQDDLIRMHAYYRRCIDPFAHLILVGGYRDQPQYHGRLVELARSLRVDEAVTFAGRVELSALVAYYRQASCFVSLSEHEGFAVPLLEAMRFGVPIVAYDAGAIGETLGQAGVLLHQRDLAVAAETCALVLEDDGLRTRLMDAGKRRLEDFSVDRVAVRTREVLGL